MGLFRNSQASHEHSLKILNYIYEYDSLTDSIKVVADMGCGDGLDVKWWATLSSRDDPPEPHNYIVYAVDKNVHEIDHNVASLPNVYTISGDFETRVIPRQVDFIWAHDSFQYAKNPWKCLTTWKETINVNGMLAMAIPQSTYIKHNKLVTNFYSDQWYNYNLANLMYMLASTGFDCRDAYFYREADSPWLYVAVYASEHKPMPGVSWYELAEKQLVSDSVINCINKYGYVKLDEVVVSWLNKENYIITC